MLKLWAKRVNIVAGKANKDVGLLGAVVRPMLLS